MRITKHFDSSEFDQRAWSGGEREEYPTKWFKGRLAQLCESLEVIRSELGGASIHILSGYRSEKFNAHIKGALHSQHVEGRAADIRVANLPASLVHRSILQMCLDGRIPLIRGLGEYPTFVHVDVRPAVNLVRWSGMPWTPGDT